MGEGEDSTLETAISPQGYPGDEQERAGVRGGGGGEKTKNDDNDDND